MSSRGCPEVHDARVRGVPLDPELLAHVAECPLCGEPAGDVAPDDVPPPVDAVVAAAAREPIGRSTRARWIGVGLVIAAFVAGLGGSHGVPHPSAVTVAGCVAVAAVALSAGAMRPPHQPAVPSWRAALAVALPIAATGAQGVELWAELPKAVRCFSTGAVVALAVYAAVALTERRRYPSPGWRVAAAGLAGAAGTVALELACTSPGTVHRGIGHGAIGLALALLSVGWSSRRRG